MPLQNTGTNGRGKFFKKVICNKRKICMHASQCGGVKPHAFDDEECNHCPKNKDAKCEETNDN